MLMDKWRNRGSHKGLGLSTFFLGELALSLLNLEICLNKFK